MFGHSINEKEITKDDFSRKCKQVNRLVKQNVILRNALKEIFKSPCNKKLGCPCCLANEALLEYLQA